MRILAACLILISLTACAVAPSDPYTAQAWAAGAIGATQQAAIDRAQIATLDADRTQSALAIRQTDAAMQATATQGAHDYNVTQIAAQHTAVMQAIQATNDWHISGLQREARLYQEYASHTQAAIEATATQGAIINRVRLDNARTNGIIYIFSILSCLISLAAFAAMTIVWMRQLQKARILETARGYIVTPLAGEPYLLTAPVVYREAQAEPVVSRVVSRTEKQDELVTEVGRLLLGSARVHGWDSNQIAGHRDLEIGGGKWHRIISAIREYVNTDRSGTTLIDGTLREFYTELNSGALNLTHPTE